MVVTEKQLRKILKARCDEAGSQRAWAKQHGLEESVVSRVVNGDRGFTDVVLKALKATRVKQYEMAEMRFEDIG